MRRGTQSYSAVYTNGAEPGSPQWDTIALGRHHTIGQAARTAQMTIPLKKSG